ncbi:hypothetical protein [Cupriavidus sp. D39]|uniref:hypothetical protein n=1 Tax=Cupriavidus sp. D39 TaxID=2997877 RepID=UPI002270AB69|nr:hypothetical protein [Cupriavidus sp. D39]MCY0853307.1 hypothetical protein [Cupriavidus sp. D39]
MSQSKPLCVLIMAESNSPSTASGYRLSAPASPNVQVTPDYDCRNAPIEWTGNG